MEVPEFVAEVPDDLVCLICMHAVGVNGTAVVTVGCGHLFCQGCIQQWLDTSGNTTCPADRQPLTKSDLRPDVRSQRRADALLVKCGSTTRGAPTEAELAEGRPAEPCTWQGAWSDLAAHEKRCPHSAPRVHCPLRVLGCTGPGSSFGMTSEVANVATRSALHFAEASEHHLRVISSAILADRARTDALQAQLEAMSRSVAQLRAAAEDAETRAMAAERRVEEALVTIVNGDMRLLHDELTVLKMSSVDHARFETTDPGEDASPPDAFTFSDLMLNPASSSQQPPSYVSRAAQQLFSLGTDGTARPLKPGWSILLGGPRGRYARHGSFEFRLCIEDLRSENDPSRADAVAAASGVMIGVTTNRGAALHHGRRGHFGFVPGSCGLQGSGFVWCGGASSLATLPDGSRITFGYGDVVTVRVGASSDNTAFTTISFGVRGEWTPPVPIGMLGRGPVFPAAALLGMEAGLRWR